MRHDTTTKTLLPAILMALLVSGPALAAPVGDHHTKDDHARLSLTAETYTWSEAVWTGAWAETAAHHGAPVDPGTVCFRLENIHAEETLVLSVLGHYFIRDDQGRDVYEFNRWQAVHDIPPGQAVDACWYGATGTSDPHHEPPTETWLLWEVPPPGAYEVAFEYRVKETGAQETIALGFTLSDDDGLYAAGHR